MLDLLHTLGDLGRALPGWVLTMTLWTAALLALALVADRLLRRHVAPSARLLLYVVVFARVALPADWQAPLSPLPSADAPAADVAVAVGDREVAAPLLSATAVDVAPTIGATVDGWRVPTAPLVGGAYLVGALALVGLGARARRRLDRDLERATPARPRVAELAPDLRILEHDHLGPLAVGVRRPTVVLPRALIDGLDDAELACVLAHERAHLVRRDPLLVGALGLATAVLWPLLPVWLAAARIRGLVELAADAVAITRVRARLYGETLLKLSSTSTPRRAPAAGLALGGFHRLRERLVALRERPRLAPALQHGLTLTLAAGALACAGRDEDPEACVTPAETRCRGLKEQAATLHGRFERAPSSDTRELALGAYEGYARECGRDPDYAEVLYYRGELLWSIARQTPADDDAGAAKIAFARAHEAFGQALAGRPTRFTRDAAYGQLLAKRRALGFAEDDPVPPAGPDAGVAGFPRSEYRDDERELLASYDTFAGHVADPADPMVQQVLLHRARLAMAHNRFDEAEAAARELLAGSDGDERHVRAAEILTDVLTIRWTDRALVGEAAAAAARDLEAWLTRVQSMALYRSDAAEALRGAVPVLEAGLLWRRAEAAEAAGRRRECAEAWQALVDRYPAHPRIDEARRAADRCRE